MIGHSGILAAMSHSIPTSPAATAALRPTLQQTYVQRLYDGAQSEGYETRTREAQVDALCDIFLGEKLPCSIGYENMNTGGYSVIIPANRKITKTLLRRIVALRFYLVPVTNRLRTAYAAAPVLEDGYRTPAAKILAAMHRQMTSAVGRRSL